MDKVLEIIEAYKRGLADGEERGYDRGYEIGARREAEIRDSANPPMMVDKINMIKAIRDTMPGGMSLRDSKAIADRLFGEFGFKHVSSF